MKISLKIAISVLVFDIVFFGSSMIQNKNFVQIFSNSFSSNSFLALIMGDGAVTNESIDIYSVSLLSVTTAFQAEISWAGGSKPYFLEFNGGRGWITATSSITTKKQEHFIDQTMFESNSPLCYRVGYYKKSVPQISKANCIDPPSGLMPGDQVISSRLSNYKLYRTVDDPDYDYRAIIRTVEKNYTPSYFVEISKDPSEPWSLLSNPSGNPPFSFGIPKNITDGASKICLRLYDYHNGLYQVYYSNCFTLASVLPEDVAHGTVNKLKASKITQHSVLLNWAKNKDDKKSMDDDIDGYAVYRDGLFIAETKENKYQEMPILEPGTKFTYTVRTIPVGLNPKSKVEYIQGTEVSFETKLATALKNTGSIKTLVIPIRFKAPRSDEDKLESDDFSIEYPAEQKDPYFQVAEAVLMGEPSVVTFFRKSSNNKLSIDPEIAPTFEVPYTSRTFRNKYTLQKLKVEANNWALTEKGLDRSKFDLVIYALPPVYGFSDMEEIRLYGNFNSKFNGSIIINGRQNYATYVHLIGYSLKLGHADLLQCATNNTKGNLGLAGFSCEQGNEWPVMDVHEAMGEVSGFPEPYYSDVPMTIIKDFDPFRKMMAGWIGSKKIEKSGYYSIPANNSSNQSYVFLPFEKLPKIFNYEISNSKYGGLYFDYRPHIDSNTSKDERTMFVKFVSSRQVDGYSKEDSNGGNVPPKKGEHVSSKIIAHSGSSADPYNLRVGKTLYIYETTNSNPGWATSTLVHSLTQNDSQTRIFVRYLKDTAPVITGAYSYTSTFNKTHITWTEVDQADGYELFRDDITALPIYTGSALNYTDPVPGRHTYYVRAYDAFIELPGETYPLEFSVSKKAEYKKLPTEAPTDLTALSGASFKQTTVTWSSVSVNVANSLIYELYRNSTTDAPIYSGKNLTYTDKVAGQHTYFVRAYRTFATFPGDVYYTNMSVGVKAKNPVVVNKPNPDNYPYVYAKNSCPSIYEVVPIYMGNAKSALAKAKSIPNAKGLAVMTSIYNSYYGDWSVPRTKIYGLATPATDDVMLHDEVPFETNDGMNRFRTRIVVINKASGAFGEANILEELTVVDNGHWVVNKGGSCKVGEMRSSKASCYATKTDIYSRKDSVWKSQPSKMSSSCPLDTIKITNQELLSPKLVAFEPSTEWFGTEGDHVTQSTEKQTGVAIIMPISVE